MGSVRMETTRARPVWAAPLKITVSFATSERAIASVQGSGGRSPPDSSEAEPEAQPDHALGVVAVGASDLPERARCEAAVRIAVQRMVEDVACLHPELHSPLSAYGERAE